MAQFNYLPTPNPVQPNVAQAPYAGWLQNPMMSPYSQAYGLPETDLLKKAIAHDIYDSIPAQFALMTLLLDRGIEYYADDVFTYMERTWNRVALTVGAAGANAAALQVIPMTNTAGVGINAVVVYPDGTHGMVNTVTTNTSITVQIQTNGGTLPAVVGGDYLTVESYIKADGMNYFVGYDRLQVVERYNYMQMFQRSKRWTRLEMQKYRNSGTTDYMEKDMALQIEEIYQDAFATYLNGSIGEYTFTAPGGAGVYRGKTANGIVQTLLQGGVQTCTSDPTTITSDFQTLAENTNYKNVNEPRFVIGTNKMLSKLDAILKDPIRYETSDRVNDLGLSEYKFGEMKFVKITCELLRANSYMFPASFENMILILDLNAIKPTCMTGYEPFEFYTTKENLSDGGHQDFSEWVIQGMISTQINNIDGHGIIYTSGF